MEYIPSLEVLQVSILDFHLELPEYLIEHNSRMVEHQYTLQDDQYDVDEQ